MEGLKLQQPLLSGVRAEGADVLGVEATPVTGGAKAHRGVCAGVAACVETKLSGAPRVRLRQGARLQQSTAFSIWQKSAKDPFSGGMGMTVWSAGAEDVYVTGTRAASACSSKTVGSRVVAGLDADCGTCAGRGGLGTAGR
jgi:hypothetical protein